MELVAGISLKGKKPKIWEPNSQYHLPAVKAVMISYAEFDGKPIRRQKAMEQGLHTYLGIPQGVKIYLDNGAFKIMRSGGEVPKQEYEEFVQAAKPDWYPIPQDYIPTPGMTDQEQLECLRQTMSVNKDYLHDGFVPVIHISRHLDTYLNQLLAEEALMAKSAIALGGIVPNLLRAPKAMAHTDVLSDIENVRTTLADKKLHVFGIGGTATLHIAALLGVDSVDSSGWRNRAARGIIQLPGSGERVVANLGNWRGRALSDKEKENLQKCPCPACRQFGFEGLKQSGVFGFSNRATHNLWILINEIEQIETHLADGSYPAWYKKHLDNTTYLPFIEEIVNKKY